MTEDPQWFVGIDWAKDAHQVCLLDRAGQIVEEKSFEHGGEGLAKLCEWLLATTNVQPGQIAVGIEVSHGPVVEILLERGFAAHALNPKQLDRFRDRFTVAGAKDDRRDAYVIGTSLRTDRHSFHQLAVDDPAIIELREWSRMAEELQRERVRLTNRIGAQLWRYYPQAIALTDDLAAEWFLALWDLAPTPAQATRLTEKRVAALLKAHRIRRITAAEVLHKLREKPLAVSAGTAEAAVAHIAALSARLRLVNRQLAEAHRQLDRRSDALAQPGAEDAPGQQTQQRDVTILRSIPGVGRIVLATLLTEAPEPLRHRDYPALRTLSGVAPVTKRSGKSWYTHSRQACHRRLRNALFHWSRIAIQHDALSRTRYDELRKRGHNHARALRTVGDRLLGVACKMLATGTTFDPNHLTRAARDRLAATATNLLLTGGESSLRSG